jgi:hypothetical protein
MKSCSGVFIVFTIVIILIFINFSLCFQMFNPEFKESSLGNFITIPQGYFIIPKDVKKSGYDIDSVFVPSFKISTENVASECYLSLISGLFDFQEIENTEGYVDGLVDEDASDFLEVVNEQCKFRYRLPCDIEWMYAFNYITEHEVPNDFCEKPYDLCFWLNIYGMKKGDTLNVDLFNGRIMDYKIGFITKGQKSQIYNRDTSPVPCGIRLVQY